jgi:hypothetical protein
LKEKDIMKLRGSIIQIDAAFDIASDLTYLDGMNLETLGETMIRCFKMLSPMINSTNVKRDS